MKTLDSLHGSLQLRDIEIIARAEGRAAIIQGQKIHTNVCLRAGDAPVAKVKVLSFIFFTHVTTEALSAMERVDQLERYLAKCRTAIGLCEIS